MNIVIWGTGENASQFIHKILPVCMKEMDIRIVDIIDDCHKREGSYFCGYKVKYPSHLNPRSEINYIVQLETYYGLDNIASKKMLGNGLEERLISLYDFCKIVNSSGFWRTKSVLFIGDKEEYDGYAYGAKYIFHYHEYHEKVEDFSGEINRFDYIFACGKWYTSQEQSIREGRKIRKGVLDKYSFDPEKIFDSTVWGLYLHSGNCRICTNGDLNPDKKFLIITFDRYCGWAIIQLFFVSQIVFAEKNGYIPIIDLMNYKTQYTSNEDFEIRNIWNYYFDPINSYSLKEVYNSQNVYLSGKRFDTDEPNDGRINYNSEMLRLFKKDYNNLFSCKPGKVLGVVYRGTDFSSAFAHPRPIDIGVFIDGVEDYLRNIGYERIFLATEVDDAVKAFKQHFSDRVFFINQLRYSRNENRILANIKNDRENDEYRKSIEYLTVLYLLTCCDSIYGIDCGSTRYARSFNDHYEHFHTFTGKKNKPLEAKLNDKIKKIRRKIHRELKIKEYSIT